MLKKLNNKKGFTLMEMLIVVAIIAVLVAVAIPTFTSALNKAKAGTMPDRHQRGQYLCSAGNQHFLTRVLLIEHPPAVRIH